MEYQLTDQEIEEIKFKGGDIKEAQEAKRQAYIKAGGVILNPDALRDLYEALKEAEQHLIMTGCKPDSYARRNIRQAIAKAEGKS